MANVASKPTLVAPTNRPPSFSLKISPASRQRRKWRSSTINPLQSDVFLLLFHELKMVKSREIAILIFDDFVEKFSIHWIPVWKSLRIKQHPLGTGHHWVLTRWEKNWAAIRPARDRLKTGSNGHPRSKKRSRGGKEAPILWNPTLFLVYINHWISIS